ncbi:MAG TPA: hypothetical protein PLZ61_07450 [Candidatus Cryosericum sp.]|nr:hypothetical protein [Candidatus Cryosericum sp.]
MAKKAILSVVLAVVTLVSAGCSARPATQGTAPEVTTQATPVGRP